MDLDGVGGFPRGQCGCLVVAIVQNNCMGQQRRVPSIIPPLACRLAEMLRVCSKPHPTHKPELRTPKKSVGVVTVEWQTRQKVTIPGDRILCRTARIVSRFSLPLVEFHSCSRQGFYNPTVRYV